MTAMPFVLDRERVSRLGAGVSLVVLAFTELSGTANAQDVAQAQEGTAPPVAAPANAAAPEDAASPNDIIVTARRREERIQDVPISITAFNEQSLSEKAITDGFELQRASPSLIATTSGNRADGLTYSMRGQSNPYGGGGASVVVYFADVPQQAGYAGAPFFDLASVQVLAGPQGTLFGQSSTGGAVLFAPRRPTENFEGYVTAGAGNLNYRKIEGAINIPLTSTIAVRFAGDILRRDGFTHDITYHIDEDDQHEENWRVGVQWTPAPWFEDYLVADGRHVHTNGTAYSIYQVFGPGLILPDNSFVDALADQQARGPREIANGPQVATGPAPGQPTPSYRVQNWGLSNTAQVHLGSVTIKDIFGYRKSIGEPDNAFDGDGTPLPVLAVLPAAPPPSIIPPGYENTPGDSYTLSDEVQILGKAFNDKLDWIVGGFYSHSNSGRQQNNFGVTAPGYFFLCTGPTPFDPCPDPSPPFTLADPPAGTSFTGGSTYSDPATRTSKAVFAQATYDLSDLIEGLKFTAGYRYSKDEVASGVSYAIFSGVPDFLLPLVTPPSSYSSHGSTYNLSLDYKLSNKVLIYFANRRGYRPGQPASPLYPGDVGHYTPLPIKPERVTDFELGVKTDWAIGDLTGRFDADGYISDYRNIQRQIASVYTSSPIGLNVDKATIKGIELTGNITYHGFTLDATYAYTDAKYDKFINTFPGPGQPANAANTPFGFVPKHKINLTGHYDVDLGGDSRLGFTAGYSWQSEFFYTDQSFNFPDAVVPSHGLLNARIDWSNVLGSQATLSVFGDNLTDETYIENGNLDAGEIGRVFYGAPRTYGVEVGYRF